MPEMPENCNQFEESLSESEFQILPVKLVFIFQNRHFHSPNTFPSTINSRISIAGWQRSFLSVGRSDMHSMPRKPNKLQKKTKNKNYVRTKVSRIKMSENSWAQLHHILCACSFNRWSRRESNAQMHTHSQHLLPYSIMKWRMKTKNKNMMILHLPLCAHLLVLHSLPFFRFGVLCAVLAKRRARVRARVLDKMTISPGPAVMCWATNFHKTHNRFCSFWPAIVVAWPVRAMPDVSQNL